MAAGRFLGKDCDQNFAALCFDIFLPKSVALEVGEEEAEDDQDGHGDAHQGHQHDVGVVWSGNCK